MQDHVIVITGATSGIGAACARVFAADGARLILSGRREDRLEELCAELGPRTMALPLDVADRDAVNAAFAALPESFAGITVLVNGAGLASGTKPVAESVAEDWDRMVDTNIKGLLNVTRAVLPGMIARNRGHVVDVGSVAGTYPSAGPVYGATKAFVNFFSLALRRELLGKNVRVTSIEPGRVDTEFNLVRLHGDTEKERKLAEDGAFLSAGDVAATIRFCCGLPEHVNVNRLEVMAINQSTGPFAFVKR